MLHFPWLLTCDRKPRETSYKCRRFLRSLSIPFCDQCDSVKVSRGRVPIRISFFPDLETLPKHESGQEAAVQQTGMDVTYFGRTSYHSRPFSCIQANFRVSTQHRDAV
jgi:hypothetical protein